MRERERQGRDEGRTRSPRVIRARCVRTKRVVALSRALIVTCHHTNTPGGTAAIRPRCPGRLHLA